MIKNMAAPCFDMSLKLTAEEQWLHRLTFLKGAKLPRNFGRVRRRFSGRKWVETSPGVFQFRATKI